MDRNSDVRGTRKLLDTKCARFAVLNFSWRRKNITRTVIDLHRSLGLWREFTRVCLYYLVILKIEKISPVQRQWKVNEVWVRISVGMLPTGRKWGTLRKTWTGVTLTTTNPERIGMETSGDKEVKRLAELHCWKQWRSWGRGGGSRVKMDGKWII